MAEHRPNDPAQRLRPRPGMAPIPLVGEEATQAPNPESDLTSGDPANLTRASEHQPHAHQASSVPETSRGAGSRRAEVRGLRTNPANPTPATTSNPSRISSAQRGQAPSAPTDRGQARAGNPPPAQLFATDVTEEFVYTPNQWPRSAPGPLPSAQLSPAEGGPDFSSRRRPFYRQPWFIVSAGAAAFVLVAIVGLGLLISSRVTQRAALRAELDELKHDAAEEIRSSIKHGDPDPDAAKEFADRAYQLMYKSAEAADPKTAEAIGAMAGRIHQLMTLHHQLTSKFTEAGEDDAFGLSRAESLAELKRAINGVAELQNFTRHVLKFTEETPEALRSIMRARGMPAPEVDTTVNIALKNMQFEQMIRLRRLDLDILDQAAGRFKLLQTYWGTWRYDDTRQRITFFAETVVSAFDAFGARISTLSQEQFGLQSTMQQQLLDADPLPPGGKNGKGGNSGKKQPSAPDKRPK